MKITNLCAIMVVSMVALMGAVGCGSEDEGTSTPEPTTDPQPTMNPQPGVNPQPGMNPGPEMMMPGVDCTGKTYMGPAMLEDSYYHVDSLVLSKPAAPSAIPVSRSGLIMADGALCVLVALTGFASPTAPSTFMLRGDSCVDNGNGTFSWSPEAMSMSAPAEMGMCGAFTNNLGGPLPTLPFQLALPDADPVTLPIQQIAISADITADGLANATLVGAITMEDAMDIMVPIGEGIALSSVLGEPDLDMNSDGLADAWSMEATLTASIAGFQ